MPLWFTIMPKCRMPGCDKEAIRKYCSTKCKNDHRNAQRKPKPKTAHKCLSCGKRFKGRADAKTCSLACRVRLNTTLKRRQAPEA